MGSLAAVVADELIESVGVLRRQMRAVAGRPWTGVELSGAEIDLVRLLRRRPGISVAQAAHVLGLAPNSVSTLVRRLGDRDWLTGERDAADRRVVRLRLTPSASRQVEAWRDHRAELMASALESLAPEDQLAIQDALPALSRLCAALRELPEERP